MQANVELKAGDPDISSNAARVVIGALGGLAAILVKYIGHDHETFVDWLTTPPAAFLGAAKELPKGIVGDLILAPILMLLGAIIGWVSNETHKVKLFLLGVSAPALIASSGLDPSVKRVGELKDALAPTQTFAQVSPSSTPNNNLRALFSDSDKNFVLYLGSYLNPEYSTQILEAINGTKNLYGFSTDFVDQRGKQFKRLFVVQRFSLSEAVDARKKLLGVKVGRDAVSIDEVCISANLDVPSEATCR